MARYREPDYDVFRCTHHYHIQPSALLAVAAIAGGFIDGRKWAGRGKKGRVPGLVYGLSLSIGIAAALLAPTLTLSQLSYVQTTTDILALLAVAVGAGLYAGLVLSPLLRARN